MRVTLAATGIRSAKRQKYTASGRRAGVHTVTACIIRIQLPVSFIESLNTAQLYYSLDWKEFIWLCRRKANVPLKFGYLEEAELIKGHVCGNLSVKVNRIPQHDVQTTMNEDNVLRHHRDSRHHKSTQWMFQGDDAVDKLAIEIRGMMDIEIFGATTPAAGA